MQREIDRAITDGDQDPLARARVALYTLLRGDAAKAEIKRRRKQPGVAFVIVFLHEREGFPEPVVEQARTLVRKSVGKHLPGRVRADIIARDGTGRTRGEPVVRDMMESEAAIQTALRLKELKKRGVDALLDALDGKHNFLGTRTANRIARREHKVGQEARVVTLSVHEDGKLPEPSLALRKALRTHDDEPDDRLRDVYAELARFHPKLAKLEEARRLFTELEDIAHHCGFKDLHSFTRVLRDFRRSHGEGALRPGSGDR